MEKPQLTVIDITQLWNCEHAFDAPCPKEWASLSDTGTNGVRHCDSCNQEVTYCSTPEEFVALGNAGKCVAVPHGHSPSMLQAMIMGRPSPDSLRRLEDRKAQIEEWWTTAIESEPVFASDAFAAIESTVKARNRPPRELSPEYRAHLVRLRDAVRDGPDALYLHLRVRPSGKRENQQNIFKKLQVHFPMSFREFKRLAKRLDDQHPMSPQNKPSTPDPSS